MHVHCADCDTTFALTPDGATQSAACPHCGGTRLERDQPSPTNSDGDLRNMVDPSTGLDQGGNPNQEGVWGQVDGGWQPWQRRDESFASVRHADFDFNDGGFDFGEKNPTHKFIIDQHGRVYSHPVPIDHEGIADAHNLHKQGFPTGMSLGELYDNGETGFFQHSSPHSADAIASMLYGHFGQPVTVDPDLKPTTNEERWGIVPGTSADPSIGTRELETLYGPPKIRQRPSLDRNEGLVRGGSLSMEPYLPWTHEAEAKEADTPVVAPAPEEPQGPVHTAVVTPGQDYGIHAGTIKWLQFLDAQINGLNARGDAEQIFHTHGNRQSPEFGKPVTVAVHHPEHLPGAVQAIETSAQGSTPPPKLKEIALAIAQGQLPPPPGIDPSKLRFGHIKVAGPAALALLPEAAGAIGDIGIGGATAALAKGALMGTGSQMAKGLEGGGGDQAPSGGASMPPPPRDPSMLSSVTADLETPHSNPGYYHDDPESIDQHEFNDGSSDPNQYNPNLDDSGASGEDAVRDNAGFAPNSPGLERAGILAPLLLHYYHSDESGANDPLIRELHEQLEAENPGYLDRADDEALHKLLQHARKPDGVHAKMAAPMIGQPTTTGPAMPGLPQQAVPSQTLPAPQQQTVNTGGRCPYCGGTTTADGSCPQCGAKVTPMGGAIQPGQNQAVPMPYTGKTAADHQGPVTDEQRAAVAQLLVETGRANEIPIMEVEPWNYAEEMAAVANRVNQPPNVDPDEPQPPQPAQEVAPPGATMPVPNPADPSQQQGMYAQGHVAADNAAPRCPNCGSGTTGLRDGGEQGDITAECHACGNIWNPGKADRNIHGKVAAPGDHGNVEAIPAADHEQRHDDAGNQDSSHTWQTDDGQPLQVGAEYEMHSQGYAIPDIVKVVAVKPDAITVETIGEYSNDQPSSNGQDQAPLSYQHEITKEEADLDGLSFVPSDGQSQAGDQSLDEYSDRNQAPVNTQAQPTSHVAAIEEYDKYFGGEKGSAAKAKASMIKEYGEERGEEVFYATVNAKKKKSAEIEVQRQAQIAAGEIPDLPVRERESQEDLCPKCASQHVSSELSSATTSFHECFRCGHGWETKEEDFFVEGGIDRDWVLTDSGPGGDDFFSEMERHKAMRESGQGSRSLSDIAARDNRLQAIKETLDANAEGRTAGKKFTPREQRAFIDEDGVARNADKLDLAGTHYEAHRVRYDLDDKANGMNAPDEHLFLGL